MAQLYAWVESALTSALTELCAAKSAQERRLRELCAVMQHASSRKDSGDSERLPGRSGLFLGITVPSLSPLKIDSAWLLSTYHRTTCALILTTIPAHFSEVLRLHFRARLWEFSQAVRRRVLGLAQGGGGRGSAVGGKEKGVQENEEGGAYKILRTGLAAMDTDMLGPHSDMLEKAGDHRDGVDGSGNTQGSPDESFLHQRGFDKALHRRQKVERAQMMQGSGERGKGAGEGGGDEEECDDDGEAMGRRKVRKRGEESESVGEEGEEGEEGEDDDDDEEEEGDDMEGMDYVLGSRGVGVGLGASEAAEVAGTSWVADVRRVATQLRDLGLMTMSEEAYANVIYSQLRGKILRLGKEQFERPVLPLIRHWIEAVPLRFLCVLLPSSSLFPSYANSKLASPGSAVTTPGPNPFPSPLASPAITAPGGDEAATVAVVRWRLRLEFYTYEILGDLRISELFDIIKDYPERLTDDSEVGASGGGDSLFEELGRSATMLEAEDSEFDPEQGDGEEAWTAAMRWDPDPVEADPSKTSRSRRMMDIISTLVGIYGSKELFVNEYRLMLADKLLAKSDYDTDRDIKTLELLKVCFMVRILDLTVCDHIHIWLRGVPL
ncbi:hypothetical protein CBR_g543 [Chara braunii]|uniref:Anaphase-promoting complex subunit 2 n=1 Tax=Chara braunii TaxID=69332 RepID=A0A388KBK4_CHABU|nr:hypothetical protein CBR_g543 [Chara braunii]|eukprot:GBG67407.1 hypothetical protein CBR_g543 [Chara braunii]